MPKAHFVPTIFASLLLASCSSLGDIPNERVGSATLSFSNGVPAGTVQLTTQGNRLRLTAAIIGAPEGVHGFHLHQTGACDRPDFKTAGGHLNPLGSAHGTLDPDGPHLGDLPNIVVGKDGMGALDTMIASDRDYAMRAIFDEDGTAVVMHAGADDYKTDPSGAAGARIACGVVKRSS